ncbi:class I SAM-dependent methyltransferase [uncultured Croceitalea sp.]|uniref:class I SAM-dependent methyltransferase n=1 Tax=uncultured Croceitalea sp. TaxID=1798908 RepID=UPI00330648B7
MKDIIGQALLDFQNNNYTEDITTYSSLDEEDVIPLPYLFRTFEEMPKIEQRALELCKGKVLDIGCGAGGHSLYLQAKELDCTALDISHGAISVCTSRGVQKTVQNNILNFSGTKFDTLLLLMNGIGIAGALEQLGVYLKHFESLLLPDGQILLDSSNIIYMFDQDEDGGYWIPDNGRYYGEVEFQMAYKNSFGERFKWLYVDFETLTRVCTVNGFDCELVMQGEHYDYLAKLALKS